MGRSRSRSRSRSRRQGEYASGYKSRPRSPSGSKSKPKPNLTKKKQTQPKPKQEQKPRQSGLSWLLPAALVGYFARAAGKKETHHHHHQSGEPGSVDGEPLTNVGWVAQTFSESDRDISPEHKCWYDYDELLKCLDRTDINPQTECEKYATVFRKCYEARAEA